MKMNKKILSAVAVLALSATSVCAGALSGCQKKDDDNKDAVTGTTYYVTAEGQNTAAGTQADPISISSILGGGTLKAGDTVLVAPGVYKLNEKIVIRSSGSFDHNITIKNASTTGEKVTLDFSAMPFASTNRGIEIYANFIYWYGIDVCGAGDNGIYIGGSYNTVEYCEFYNNRDTGLQIGRQESSHNSINQWPSYNLVKNCTSHNNYDNETYGENADGFAAKLTVGYGNVFDGCIAYRNSDDGWDLYAKSDSGNIGQVIMYNCVAFENGYLEYTQAECNANYTSFNTSLAESNTNSYTTRDGDGNGFKLGGSVMEGDVLLYNCLSFANRMHGVTDNSNPGYLYVDGVTSYNNSAAIDNNPDSETFGKIISAENYDEHNNIDVARQTYSYNTVRNTVSLADDIAKSLGRDEYRGSVADSVLLGSGKANLINGNLDADTRNDGQTMYISQTDRISPADVFEKLPVVKSGDSYSYNIDGSRDMGNDYAGGAATKADRVHHKYRNADESINMGDILAIKDYSKLLGADKKIGSVLNKGSWAEYEHFTEGGIPEGVTSSIQAALEKAKESLYVTTDEHGVYQNFDVPTKLNGCMISWASSNEDILKIGTDYDVSLSGSEYVKVDVTRPQDADTKVTLTATISYFNRSITKDIELNVKKDEPRVGSLYVVVGTTGEVIENDGTIIFDQYQQYDEPLVKVTNGAYKAIQLESPELKSLTPEQYDLSTKYEYATEDGKPYMTVSSYTPNVAGVFRITHTVTLKGDASSTNTMSYKIFVASTNAALDWSTYDYDDADTGAVKGEPINTVSVNQLGYKISGRPNSAIGSLYAFTSSEKLNPTADMFVGENAVEGVVKHDFRATSIEYQYDHNNNASYYIYYALANGKNEILPNSIYEKQVKTVNVDNAGDFYDIAHAKKLSDEDPMLTIYMLTNCIDLSSYNADNWNSSGKFRGVLNGQGHTISNFTINKAGMANGKTSIFYEVDGGSIMNVKFDNITLKSTGDTNGQKAGIIGTCYGGYFYNIQITNIEIRSTQRSGALIAQLNQGSDTYIERVSVVNTDDTKRIEGLSSGGIIGLIQIPSGAEIRQIHVYIKDCHTHAQIGAIAANSRYSGGIVGRYDTQLAGYDYYLQLTSCWSSSSMYAGYNSAGGILGAQQGTGKLDITNCMFTGELYHAFTANPNPDKLITSQKYSSGMIGAFVASAEVTILNCISVLPEYNSEYQEEVSVEYVYEKVSLIQDKFTSVANGGVWIYNYEDGDTTSDWLETPNIMSLQFEGCDCNAEN